VKPDRPFTCWSVNGRIVRFEFTDTWRYRLKNLWPRFRFWLTWRTERTADGGILWIKRWK
jgi:hypothetical protein